MQQPTIAPGATLTHKALPFAVLGACFVLVRLLFMFTVPISEAPDEITHLWVISFIKQHLCLPSASDLSAAGAEGVYGSLPQMGYLPHILLSLPFATTDICLAARFGSLIMGFVTFLAAYLTGRELFASNRVLSLCLPALVVFHPQLAFLNSYTNSDSTAVALSSLIVLLLIRSAKSSINSLRCLAIGILLGWLALSKYSGLSIAPVVVLSLVASAFLHKTPLKKAVLCLALSAAAFSCVSLWWFQRNYFQFDGDFLGTKTMYRAWALAYHKDPAYRVPAESIVTSLRWWRMMFFSFWGLFGYMTRYLWRPVYLCYVAFLSVSVWGWLQRILVRTSAADRTTLLIWSTLAATVLFNLTAMVFASTVNLGGPQGRYLFCSEIPVMSLLLGGMSHLKGKAGSWLPPVFVSFNVLVCLGSWLMLFLISGFHSRPL